MSSPKKHQNIYLLGCDLHVIEYW